MKVSFKNDLKDSKGIYKTASGNVYEGEYTNDLKEGKGFYKWANGNIYEGGYKNDLREAYEGEWKGGNKEGKGVLNEKMERYMKESGRAGIKKVKEFIRFQMEIHMKASLKMI